MRKFIYLAKTTIIGELNAPIINNIQQKQEVIITIQKDNAEIVMKLYTDQSKRLIKELEILTAEAEKFNKTL